MSVLRKFDEAFEQHGSIRRAMVRVVCGRCNFEGSKPRPFIKGFSHSSDGEQAKLTVRKFERDGWRIGLRPQEDRCPACVKAVEDGKKHLRVVKEEPAMAEPKTEARVMSRDERRVIFAKLEDVYPSENNGYSAGWTDEKVAIDLGVPRAWVETVRKEFFGEVASNPEITAMVEEAKGYLAEAQPLLQKIEQTKTTLGSLMAEAQKLAMRGEMIEKRLHAIEKAVRA